MKDVIPATSLDVSPATDAHGWTTRSFAFVTLWAGRESGARVLDWLATAEIPPQSVLYWVDNSGGRETANLQRSWRERLQSRFQKLVFIDAGQPHSAPPENDLIEPGRYDHLVELYNSIFPQVWEDMVVTLEDDTVPPADGLRRLLALLPERGRVAMVAGVYRNRGNPRRVTAACDRNYWQKVPAYDELPPEPFDVGMSGAGFALIANRVLQQVLPVRRTGGGPKPMLGWDANMGRDFTALGYRVLAHPGVRCAHLCPEVEAYEAALRANA